MMVVMMSTVQLFRPVFGHFLDDIADEKLDVLPETLQAAADFMTTASSIYEKEDSRKSTVMSRLTGPLHGHDQDCQSRSDPSGWHHISDSNGRHTRDGSYSPA